MTNARVKSREFQHLFSNQRYFFPYFQQSSFRITRESIGQYKINSFDSSFNEEFIGFEEVNFPLLRFEELNLSLSRPLLIETVTESFQAGVLSHGVTFELIPDFQIYFGELCWLIQNKALEKQKINVVFIRNKHEELRRILLHWQKSLDCWHISTLSFAEGFIKQGWDYIHA